MTVRNDFVVSIRTAQTNAYSAVLGNPMATHRRRPLGDPETLESTDVHELAGLHIRRNRNAR